MLKQKHLNRWLWRWHIIAGLITLPIIIVLCITGIIYLFKAHYNNAVYDSILFTSPSTESQQAQSYQSQFASVRATTEQHITQVFLPETAQHTTGFRTHGKGHSRHIIYVDPFSAEIRGQINQKDTLMYTIRKLHGEILLDTPGTLVIELVASWFIVLIITGLYVWWPTKRFSFSSSSFSNSLSGLFTIRFRSGRKTLWRDLHVVLGFWLSLFMLVMLAGGMPWTDGFGQQLKWVQEKTDTGYPKHWRSPKELRSNLPNRQKENLTIDDVVNIAKEKQLKGKINIKLPMNEEGVFTIANRSFWLSDQQVLHIDQYSGAILKQHDWSDVGILMELRQLAMRFHQGEYGLLNWWVVLLLTSIFTFSTLAGLASYLIRKPKGRWGLPTMPNDFNPDKWVLFFIALLAIVFPLFGASLLCILLWSYFKNGKKQPHSQQVL